MFEKSFTCTKGTPQGGVASPLLANLYLHWFDRVFQSEQGSARSAKAVLVRYADDFVILSRKITPRLEGFVSEKIEQWLGLKINRDKTRIYEVKTSENGLDFLGYNFRLALAPHGPKRRYWRVAPEQKVSTTRNSPTASNDLQSATTHTDYRTNRTTQPAPAGMEELLRQVALWSGYAADQLATRKPAETAPSAAKSATLANPRRKHTVSAT
jgi:hypothetical protein